VQVADESAVVISAPAAIDPAFIAAPSWHPIRRTRLLVGGEIDRVLISHLRGGRVWRGCAIALTAAAGCAVMQWASIGHRALVEHLSAIREYQPLVVVMGRLPLSLVAPTNHLPLWGAVAQVLVVFWLAQLNLGLGRTLALIVLFHTTATLAGRFMIDLGPHAWLHLGVAHSVAFVRDTGPSAAVVGLCVYLGCAVRAPILAGLVAATMIGELVWKPDLAGREHVVAMVVALLIAIPLLVRPTVRPAVAR